MIFLNSDKRLHVIIATTAILCCGLIGRLVFLQIIVGPEFEKRANAQRTGEFLTEERGDVFDRNGVSLTDSRYDTYAIISPILLTPPEQQLLKSHHLLEDENSENPQEVNVSQENKALMEQFRGKTPGVFIYEKRGRYGPNALATHLVGYGGQTGIEKVFDNFLNGDEGVHLVKDGLGQPIGGLSEGATSNTAWGVKLTIDKDIQKAIEDIMDQSVSEGAVVMLNAKNGEILAMASRPNYKQYEIEHYLDKKFAPLINRAVVGFSPGSIFKIVILAAALEEKVASLDEIFHCSGLVKIGENEFKCASYKSGGHGDITLREAMAKSCNSVFIELGLRLGRDKIIEYAKLLGLGHKTSLGLAEEEAGLIPAPTEVYYEDTGNLAMGQGPIEITPLQASQMMMTVINGGVEKKPFIVKEIIDSKGISSTPPLPEGNRTISRETSLRLVEALKDAVKYGTGVRAMPSDNLGESAGKTGTAEVAQGIYHSWFLGFHPADEPDYVICVFIERGGSGAVYAAPIFKEIIEKLDSTAKKP